MCDRKNRIGCEGTDLPGSDAEPLFGESRRLTIIQTLQSSDKGESYLSKPKTKHSRRTIALPAIAILAIRAHKAKESEVRLQLGKGIKPDDLVTEDALGRPWSPNALTQAWRKFVRKNGFRALSLHSLRHRHATLLLKENTPIKVVSSRLGHSSSQITLDVYGHVLAEMEEAAADAMDRLFDTKPA